jgi:hypothetical protein
VSGSSAARAKIERANARASSAGNSFQECPKKAARNLGSFGRLTLRTVTVRVATANGHLAVLKLNAGILQALQGVLAKQVGQLL